MIAASIAAGQGFECNDRLLQTIALLAQLSECGA
jgi:hypothetical protein